MRIGGLVPGLLLLAGVLLLLAGSGQEVDNKVLGAGDLLREDQRAGEALPDDLQAMVAGAVDRALDDIGHETNDQPGLPRLTAVRLEPEANPAHYDLQVILNANVGLDVNGFLHTHYRRTAVLFRELSGVPELASIEVVWQRRELPLLTLTAEQKRLEEVDWDDPLVVLEPEHYTSSIWHRWLEQ